MGLLRSRHQDRIRNIKDFGRETAREGERSCRPHLWTERGKEGGMDMKSQTETSKKGLVKPMEVLKPTLAH